MAKCLIVDGCEKAGKSTFVALFAKLVREQAGKSVKIRKQSGAANPDWTIYMAQLAEDLMDQSVDLIIWDRSWLSEVVYSMLMPGRSIPDVPEVFNVIEDLSDHMARLVLLGPDTATLVEKRDQTDMPVDPAKERELFRAYGTMNGWLVLANQHTERGLSALVLLAQEELDRIAV